MKMIRETETSKLLYQELDLRKKRNRYYSLRAFGLKLDIPSGRLSEYLNGKRVITNQVAQRIVNVLNYDEEKSTVFFQAVQNDRKCCEQMKMFGKKNDIYQNLKDINDFQIECVKDPDYFSIMALCQSVRKPKSLLEISKRLGLCLEKVESMMNLLFNFGFIKFEEEGYILISKLGHKTSQDVISSALKIHHKRKLIHAVEAQEEVDITLRDITSTTICIDKKNILEAKNAIRDFRMKMTSLLGKGEAKNVYYLNVQLVPANLEKKCEMPLSCS